MSDTSNAVNGIVIPAVINLNTTTDIGPRQEQRDALDRTQAKQVSAVAFLNKLEQEAIIRENEPVLEKLQKEFSALNKKVERQAARVLNAIKVDDDASAVKKALNDWGINGVKIGVELKRVNIDDRVIEVEKSVSVKDESRYNSCINTGVIDVAFDDVLTALADKVDALDKRMKDVQEILVTAHAKLKNRANLLADAQGALALKTMSKAEVEAVRDMYDTVKSGITVEKLLGAGK